MDNKLLGKKIKFLRSKKSSELGYKYTGQMLADKLSISRSYLGDIESGRIHPNPGLLSRLASALDVDVNFFIEENDISEAHINHIKKKISDKEKKKQIETVAAHLEDKNLTPKKVKLLKDYIDALFDDEEC